MNSITNRQMVMILFITLTCYSIIVIPKVMAENAGTGNWITLILTALIFGLAAVVIVSLNSLFQGKMLFDYAPQIVGKPIAYVIVVFYILYFFFIVVYLITMKARLLKADFFPQTPLWSFPFIGIPVFCFIANKGITNIGRLAEIIGIVFIVTAIFVHFIMMTQGKISRIQPFFNAADIKKYIEGFKYSIFPFLGIEVLLAIPLTKKNGSKAKKTVFLTLVFIGLFYIFLVESCIMKIGLNDIVNYKDPLIVAIRDTSPEFIDIFTRLDILYLTIGFGAIFVGVSIVFAVIAEYLCRIFNKINRPIIVTAVGIMTYIIFFIVKDLAKYEQFVEDIGTYVGIVTCIVIPGLLFILAKIRKVKKKGKSNAS